MRRKFTLQQAQDRSPLVRNILRDICDTQAALSHLDRRLDLLFECRHSSRYEVRKQYYESQRQQNEIQQKLEKLVEELDDLGAKLMDPVRGIAGFPFRLASTKKSKRTKAYFLLKLCDDPDLGLKTWQRAGEEVEHQIPVGWHEEVSLSASETDTPVF